MHLHRWRVKGIQWYFIFMKSSLELNQAFKNYSYFRYAQYLSGTNQPANHPPNQPPNQPSDTMYLTNPHQQNHFIPGNHGNHGHYNNHGGFGNHGNNGHNNHQLVTTTALMANRISPLPRVIIVHSVTYSVYF